MKINPLLIALLILFQNPIQGQKAVYFQSDSSALSKDVRAQIDVVISDLTVKKEFVEKIVLTGHTDSDGSQAYNEELSMVRAERVKRYMAFKGFPEAIFEMKWYGENKPAASNATEREKQMNRRVEIDFFYHDILPQLQPESKQSQFFTGRTTKNLNIEGEEGTRIHIPANCLEYKTGGTATGRVEVELKEFYKTSDIIKANLYTRSAGRILETGGMIKLDVTVNGKEVVIKAGAAVEVLMPADEYKENMNVFYGDVDERNVLDWREAETPSINQNFSSYSWSLYTVAETNIDKVNKIGRREVVKIKDTLNRFTDNDNYVTSGYNLQIQNNGFGYINCDRFRDAERPVKMAVEMGGDISNSTVVLVFEEMNSILPAFYNPKLEQYEFYNVPKNQKAKLVAFSKTDRTYKFEAKDIRISSRAKLNPAPITAEQFEKGLALLNE